MARLGDSISALVRVHGSERAKSRLALPDVEARARESGGSSDRAIYEMAARAIAARHTGSGVLVDVRCGVGHLCLRSRSCPATSGNIRPARCAAFSYFSVEATYPVDFGWGGRFGSRVDRLIRAGILRRLSKLIAVVARRH